MRKIPDQLVITLLIVALAASIKWFGVLTLGAIVVITLLGLAKHMAESEELRQLNLTYVKDLTAANTRLHDSVRYVYQELLRMDGGSVHLRTMPEAFHDWCTGPTPPTTAQLMAWSKKLERMLAHHAEALGQQLKADSGKEMEAHATYLRAASLLHGSKGMDVTATRERCRDVRFLLVEKYLLAAPGLSEATRQEILKSCSHPDVLREPMERLAKITSPTTATAAKVLAFPKRA